MFSSFNARKVARLAATSVVAGATVALVLLGGPADAAVVIASGRGF